LQASFADIDAGISALERRLVAGETLALAETLEETMRLARRLVDAAHPPAAAAADLLGAFKLLARSDPAWNAVRDNLRELVFYRNCVDAGRIDALPPVPEKMAVRTTRHLYLYFRTRCG
jgi:hypothetical protein